ncbi:hypothetical protein P7C71_g5175, partial [Lecanoromycetidae sp. Uapishka_2]
MADIRDIGEAESSDEDSVSLTSTVPSFHEDDEIYVVEEIVAETFQNGRKEFLVKWEGKPIAPKVRSESNRDSPANRRDSSTSIDSLIEELQQKSMKRAKTAPKEPHKAKNPSPSLDAEDTKAITTGLELKDAESTTSRAHVQAITAELTSPSKSSFRSTPLRKNISGLARPTDTPTIPPSQDPPNNRPGKQGLQSATSDTKPALTEPSRVEPLRISVSGKLVPNISNASGQPHERRAAISTPYISGPEPTQQPRHVQREVQGNDAMIIDHNELDTSMLEKNESDRNDNSKATTSSGPNTVSANTDNIQRAPGVDPGTSTASVPPSEQVAAPIGAPTGPRESSSWSRSSDCYRPTNRPETRKITLPSPEQTSTRSLNRVENVNDVKTNPEQVPSSSDLSSFTLMASPTAQQKYDLVALRDENYVIGNLWLEGKLRPEAGPNDDTPKVKFLGGDEIKSQVKANPITPDEPNINVVFRDMFEIEYARLIAPSFPQSNKPAGVFFLCFIPQGCEYYELDPVKRMILRESTSKEHDLFVEFLEANGAEEIYSMQDIGSIEVANNGAWDYFYKNVTSGTIIFHDACIRIDLIPNLARFLRNGAINVLKTSLSPMTSAEKHPHLVRFFPHGGVILLTESLILCRPREALRIIMWFRRAHLPSKQSGTWKLAARPRFREWLLDLLDLYTDTQKDVFGHGIQIIADIYTEILWLLEDPNQPLSYQVEDFDTELPTREAPLVTSSSLKALQARKEWKGDTPETIEIDHHNIAQNDDLLIQWFAEWAIVHLDSFRKFHAVLGCPAGDETGKKSIKNYENRWGHIEVFTAEDCFSRHKVTPQDKLDEMEAERRRKLREMAPKVKAEAIKARKEERLVAKAALETRIRVWREHGASEEEVAEAGRRFLRDTGGSEME